MNSFVLAQRGGWARLALGLCLGWVATAAFAFDGQRALASIEAQCALGPRVPGTPAHAQWLDWAEAQCMALGLHTERQTFSTTLPLVGKPVQATNLYAYAAADGPTSPALVISAHWDTRPYADRDPSGTNPPMLGANDGASGVAAALELARSLKGTRYAEHLALAFWDAEDSGVYEDMSTWALGARHAAAHPPKWAARIVLGINLDLVGGDVQQLMPELHSVRSAPRAVEELWTIGGQLYPRVFVQGEPREVTDDHLPWVEAGYPWVDLLGLPWQHWHTAGDRPENCSAASLQAVGDVVVQYVIGGKWRTER